MLFFIRFMFIYTAIMIGFFIAAYSASADSEKAFGKLRQAVVRLPYGSGGVVLTPSKKARVITNYHVCLPSADLGNVTVTLQDGTTHVSPIVKLAPNLDLCLLEPPAHTVPLKLSDRETGRMSHVFNRGYPLGILSESEGMVLDIQKLVFSFQVPYGYPCKRPAIDLDNGTHIGCFFEYINQVTSLYSQGGSSGSPIVNEDGELVGVMQTKHRTEGGGFLPLSAVKQFLKGE